MKDYSTEGVQLLASLGFDKKGQGTGFIPGQASPLRGQLEGWGILSPSQKTTKAKAKSGTNVKPSEVVYAPKFSGFGFAPVQ